MIVLLLGLDDPMDSLVIVAVEPWKGVDK